MSTTAAAAPPQPAHDTTTTTPAPAPADTAQIHTYHCLCTQLLLASTTPLALIPRRGASASASSPEASSSDSAFILPLPGSPPTTTEADDAQTEASPHYALPLSLQPDRTPLVIQRPDGLEKRYCARCARCRVVVGYWLDWSQFAGAPAEGNKARTGRRDNVVYLLPGGLLSTEEMAGGRRGEAEGEQEGQGQGRGKVV